MHTIIADLALISRSITIKEYSEVINQLNILNKDVISKLPKNIQDSTRKDLINYLSKLEVAQSG